ncbi:MAG: chemotaxis protein CheW [Syntrophobacteraceae bacterium]|jgi:purine-binding chemotaxis protein CheW
MEKPVVAAPGKTAKVRNAAFKGYKDGSCEFLGDQIEGLVGYSRKDFNSKALKWTDLVIEEDTERIKQVFAQALQGDKTYMREYRVRAGNGDILWIREWSQIVCEENGQIEFATGIVMDITEEKQQEMLLLNCERKTGKYLTFSVANEEYGISILKVKEIIEVMAITVMPQAPPYVKGVINLRGKIIPVADLRTRLGIRESGNTHQTCIIVLETTRNETTVLAGMVVDSVSEVLHIKGSDIEDVHDFMLQFNSDCVLGMAKMDSGLKIILDVDKVLGEVELGVAANF